MQSLAVALLFMWPAILLAETAPDAAHAFFRALSHAGSEPVVAYAAPNAAASAAAAALVQLSPERVAIVVASEVRPGRFEIVSQSKPFTLSREQNFGAWVERLRFTRHDRIELALTTRSGCARSLSRHRFVLRQRTWLVAGLDTLEPRCTSDAVETAWTESSNYLTGRVVRTDFAPLSRAPAKAVGMSPRKPFPLTEFPPPGPETAYADLR